jgi:2-polyprenyl-6-methoxyphenol hydroxylase-like FAD-dependent oxidoreductase
VAEALRRYQRRRQRRARAAHSQARMLARLGGWRSPMACWLREQMIRSAPRRAQTRQLRQMFSMAG